MGVAERRGIVFGEGMYFDLFLSHVSEAAAFELRGSDDAQAWLDESIRAAEVAFLELQLPREAFVERVARCLAALPSPAAYRKLLTTDVYLACACTRGDPRALVSFEKRYLPAATRALRRLRVPDTVASEILAGLPARLFVGSPDAEPLVAKYSGRSSLAAWLRSVVVNAALNALRNARKHTGMDDVVQLVGPGNPELAYVKKAYGTEFESALRDAMASLPERERTVLRQRYLEGLNIDALGELYGVHRATVARWIADACERILAHVRTSLAHRTRMSENELDSIIRVGSSELDATLSGLLRTKP
jgi:RNA polymerase sigma-70 factor (ECF subfamily)